MTDERKNELLYTVAMQCVIGFANVYTDALLERFGSAEEFFRADDAERRGCGLLNERQCRAASTPPLDRAREILDRCGQLGISVILFTDSEYPELLRNISDPPLVLYIKGRLPDFSVHPAFCVIGPRKCSDFGKKAAYSLAARLSMAGFVIVSGGAVGGDKFAHLGALRNGGRTVAVLGTGIDSRYLAANEKLREEIAQQDCLLTEYPPGHGVTKYSFPLRNRLMSALCLGVAVVEAGASSGTLNTSRHAAEQGRDVFVVPGNPTDPRYKGSNALLRDGAHPLLDASDIFNLYLPHYADRLDMERAFSGKIVPMTENLFVSETAKKNVAVQPRTTKKQPPAKEKAEKIQKKLPEGLSKEAKIVYNHIDKQKFSADDLLNTGLSADQLLSALTELEMEQVIAALPGGYYSLV